MVKLWFLFCFRVMRSGGIISVLIEVEIEVIMGIYEGVLSL